MRYPKQINLEIDREYYNPIPAQQGDTARVLNFKILDNGISFNLTGKSVRVRVQKPDGTKVWNDLTIINALNGECSLNLTDQLLAVPGWCRCQLEITEGQDILSTIVFSIDIRASVDINRAVESTNEFAALEKMMQSVEKWEKYFEETSGKIEEKYTGELNKLNNIKANANEVVIKGSGTLSDFNEETRRVLQGLDPGQINAVLGDGNIKTNNIGLGEVSFKNSFMFEAKILNKGFIIVDFFKGNITLKKDCYVIANNNISRLASSGDVVYTIPDSTRVKYILYDNETSIVSIKTEGIKKTEMLLAYIYLDSVYGINKNLIEVRNENEDFNNTIVNEIIANKLKNKIKVKFIGDSIVAGVASTGYGLTTIPIGNTGKFAPKQTSSCWVNLLARKIEDIYNKNSLFTVDELAIELLKGVSVSNDKFLLRNAKYFAAVNEGTPLIEFKFTGNQFKIYFAKQSGSGIVGIYLDGNKIDTIDLYSSEDIYSFKYEKTQILNTEHNVTVKLEGKNPLSISTRIYIEAIELEKKVECVNWGISGINSEWLLYNFDEIVKADDDIIFMQIGTNDRIFKNIASTLNNLRDIANKIKEKNKELVLCCSLPTSKINNDKYDTKMSNILSAINKVACENNIETIDHYNYFMMKCKENNENIDIYLADGLHPNDGAYELMYYNAAKTMNLPL